MRVPFSWIKEYVAWQGSVEELAELLTMSGTEVEGIHWVGAPRDPENLALFVVGRVLTREKHPNADKLSLCTVDVGEANGGERQIVCGASNFAAGDTVAVALSGAQLENGLKLKKMRLRGVESDGMMLSAAELGFEEQSAGILVLPSEWVVGSPLQGYLPVSEAVLELEITPNRPDCYNIYGVAREIAAAGGLELLAPPVAAEASPGGAPAADTIAVEITAPDLCSRYGARVIREVVIADSAPWLKAKLTHAGMRPINNVVDVTNYVMLAWGQPLHAFDADKIAGGKLIVRRAQEGERIVTLDEVERTLEGEMLVIADVERPLVIAGVFGSVDAEIDDQTTSIVLEAATFSGPSIMRTEMRTGIRSESSTRFEKGLDANLVPGGLDFASRLFAELCGGVVAPGAVVAGGAPAPLPALTYRPSACDALLGYTIPHEEQEGILLRLQCRVEVGEERWTVRPPSFRPDLVREVDLIEEVGRIAGYSRSPETLPRSAAAGGLSPLQRVRRRVRAALAACGLDEVITYTFIAEDSLEPLGLPAESVRLRPVHLRNPMSAEQSVMRTSLLPGLLGVVRSNVARLNGPPNIFELGNVYLWDEDVTPAPSHAGLPDAVLPHEPEVIGVLLSAPTEGETWTAPARPTDFFTLKGVVEAVLGELSLEGSFAPLGDDPEFAYLHPGESAAVSVRGAGVVGALGSVRPDVAAACGLEGLRLYVALLDFDRLSAVALSPAAFAELDLYPPAEQDLAVVVSREVAAAEVVAAVAEAGGKLVRDVRVFDVYEGEPVPEGMVSLALRITMRSAERTLSEKAIAGVRQKIVKALERRFKATLR